MTIEAMKAIQMVYANTTKHDWPDDIWEAICQAIETERQKPYGYLKLSNGKFYVEVVGVPDLDCNPDYLPLHTHPQPKAEKHEVSQEPVAYLLRRQDRSGYETGEKTDYGAFPVYTASQQHTWIGLTDEDCERMSAGDKVVAMWAERTLKKKNTHQQPKREWVGLTDEEIDQGLLRSDYALQTAHAWRAGVVFAMTQLKEKNT